MSTPSGPSVIISSQNGHVTAAEFNDDELLAGPSYSTFVFLLKLQYVRLVNNTASNGPAEYPRIEGIASIPLINQLTSEQQSTSNETNTEAAASFLSYPIPTAHETMFDSTFRNTISFANTDADGNQIEVGDGELIDMETFRSLRPGEYLNEGAIGAFLRLLIQRSRLPGRAPAFAFEPQFFRNHIRPNAAAISSGFVNVQR